MENSRTLVNKKLSMSKEGKNYLVGGAFKNLLGGVKTRSFTSGEIMTINIYCNDPIAI